MTAQGRKDRVPEPAEVWALAKAAAADKADGPDGVAAAARAVAVARSKAAAADVEKTLKRPS